MEGDAPVYRPELETRRDGRALVVDRDGQCVEREWLQGWGGYRARGAHQSLAGLL